MSVINFRIFARYGIYCSSNCKFYQWKNLGDENASITGVSPIENAKMVNSLLFLKKNLQIYFLSEASVIIVSEKFVKEEKSINLPLL